MDGVALTSVALCGSGLALWMSAAAFSKSLPNSVQMTVVETEPEPASDMFYGPVLPPQFYDFHLSIDLSEPELLLNTASTFVFGTQMQNWAQPGRSWVQAFHQPLPVWEGVPLTKLIQQHPHATLQSTLISAQAAKKGVFAHPSEDPEHPLSRAEYGYAINPVELSRLYKAVAMRRNLRFISAQIEAVTRHDDTIASLTLADGQTVEADLFIDCTGPSAVLRAESLAPANTSRSVTAMLSRNAGTPLGAPVQRVSGGDAGWRSDVGLRSGALRLTVGDTSSEFDGNVCSFQVGRVENAWHGNTIAIGHAASILEPFTVAPMKLLLRDIERVQSLLPVSSDMRIEAQQFNRAARDDYDHAMLFNQAHFAVPDLPDTPYWQTAAVKNDAPKLVRKLTQYDSRGHLVAYDNEPFDAVDWAVLHDGMGRTPHRGDPLAAAVKPETVQFGLDTLQKNIKAVVAKMPPHPVYMSKFIAYLHRKYSRNG